MERGSVGDEYNGERTDEIYWRGVVLRMILRGMSVKVKWMLRIKK